MPSPFERPSSGGQRGLIAQFLNYYPQYRLSDLRTGSLPVGDYYYLLAGMLDNISPTVGEPFEEKITRLNAERVTKKTGW